LRIISDGGLPRHNAVFLQMLTDKNVLLIGGTQGTGLETARILEAQGASLRVFARNPAKARELFDESVTLIVGDLRSPERMPEAVDGVDIIIFTAGVTKRPSSEELIVSTEFEGMKSTLAAAAGTGFRGRFLFLSSIGVTRQNWASRLLNNVKGKALKWRKAMEDEIRKSDFDYTIVRAGYLMNSDSTKKIVLDQPDYPLELRYRIGRKETARVFVEAMKSQAASKKTFAAFRSRESGENEWEADFESLGTDKE